MPSAFSETAEKIRKRPAAYPVLLATSSEKAEGIEALQIAIEEAVGLREPDLG
jgi:GTP-binding protein